MSTYDEFLESKIVIAERHGFDVAESDLHPALFPHQKDAVRWALSLGTALIAMSFGLGKTRIACEIARLVVARTGRPFLVVCPLGVKHQFQEEDGPALGMNWVYVRNDDEADLAILGGDSFLITNYERVRDGDLTPAKHRFAGVNLDEGSVLRSLGSKTYDVFTDIFAEVPFRFVCTATPSPNEYTELLGYAQFLGIMDRGQALTRWFKRDSTHAGHLTLHPHHEREFWLFVASWALFVFRPSDLGHDDTGYDLPELQTDWRRIAVDHSRAWAQADNQGQRRLFLDAANGVKEATAEKRATLDERIGEMLAIMDAGGLDGQWVIWCHLNQEQAAAEAALKARGISVSSIYGSLDIDETERRLYEWKRKETQVLLSKPVMLGAGLNLQQCHKVIFLGIDYKFQDFIQALHRNYRFQQLHDVQAHIIYAESEDQVVAVLKRKWQEHNRLVDKMRSIVKEYGLTDEALKRDLTMAIGVQRQEVKGRFFTLINNDCTAEVQRMEDNSVGLLATSIPFGNHYSYTTNVEDYGHNEDDGKFWEQMDFLIPHLLRILKPGRIAAIHVKNRILYGHQTKSGFMEVSPFVAETIFAFRKHGFIFAGEHYIKTDVVRENSSTYRLGWTEMTKDSTKMGAGLGEELLLFRKPPTSNDNARADEPVTHDKSKYSRGRWQIVADGLWRSNGNRLLTPDELAQLNPTDAAAYWEAEQRNEPYDFDRHVAITEAFDKKGRLPASFGLFPPRVTRQPEDWIWDDIVAMRCLNSEQSRSRQENHICPLPFDIVERTIDLYSNPSDVVFDPFDGIGTVVYLAIKMGRYGIGTELNPSYFAASVKYCQDAEREKLAPTLFDYLALQQAQAGAD